MKWVIRMNGYFLQAMLEDCYKDCQECQNFGNVQRAPASAMNSIMVLNCLFIMEQKFNSGLYRNLSSSIESRWPITVLQLPIRRFRLDRVLLHAFRSAVSLLSFPDMFLAGLILLVLAQLFCTVSRKPSCSTKNSQI